MRNRKEEFLLGSTAVILLTDAFSGPFSSTLLPRATMYRGLLVCWEKLQ